MYSNQPGEREKKNTIQQNDSEDGVGGRIWTTVCTRDGKFSSPGFYLMRKREKLASIMVGTS